jgi:serine/threonine protein kinase
VRHCIVVIVVDNSPPPLLSSQAVDACHRAGVCVCDLKPDNMLVAAATTESPGLTPAPRVLFCDFEGMVDLPPVRHSPTGDHFAILVALGKSGTTVTQALATRVMSLRFSDLCAVRRRVSTRMPLCGHAGFRPQGGRARCQHGRIGMPWVSPLSSSWYAPRALVLPQVYSGMAAMYGRCTCLVGGCVCFFFAGGAPGPSWQRWLRRAGHTPPFAGSASGVLQERSA